MNALDYILGLATAFSSLVALLLATKFRNLELLVRNELHHLTGDIQRWVDERFVAASVCNRTHGELNQRLADIVAELRDLRSVIERR